MRQTLAGGDAKQDGFCPPVSGDAEDVSDDENNDFEKTGFDMPDVNYMDEQENAEPNLVSEAIFL